MTKRKVLLVLLAGIVINVVAAGLNISKGGWWLLFIPGHLAAIGACGYALHRTQQWRDG